MLPDILAEDAARLPGLDGDVGGLASAAAAARLPLRTADLKALVAEAADQQRLVDAQRRLVGGIGDRLGVDVVELPLLNRGADSLSAIRSLARSLRGLGPRAQRRRGARGPSGSSA